MVLEINPNGQLYTLRSELLFNSIQQKNYPNQATYAATHYTSDFLMKNAGFYKYFNEKAIKEMIRVSAEIKNILKLAQIPFKINMKILNDLIQNHLPHTKNIAVGISSNLPTNFKANVNIHSLQKAAILHDIGKILIPEEILNKKGSLTKEEFAIIQNHSTLSYEMLKSTDLDDFTLHLIKNHHQNAQKNGYPKVTGNFVADINLQILSVADIYSALREKRSYKAELSKNKALDILHKDLSYGKFHPVVFKALVDYANNNEHTPKIQASMENPLLQTCRRLLGLNRQKQLIPS
jgi:putative nucleotidyltransferase with HDIG domain